MKPGDFSFFKDFLNGFFESAFLYNQINSATCDRLKSWSNTPEARAYATRLFRDRVIDIREHRLKLQLKSLLELNGKEFNHIEILFTKTQKRRKRKCFVGHRFLPSLEKTLRWNLRQVLEPYRVELDWSGRDIRSVQILEDIVERIKTADFCVFDNQATAGRPNVYIEAGMCIVLRKPFILFEHEPASRSPNPPDPDSIPSDLSFALALRYKNYKELFREFYFRLPVFFEKNVPRG